MIAERKPMITPGRQLMAFVFRDFSLTKRYLGWVVVFTFYAMVNSATIALIGVAAKDEQLTLTLIVGVLLFAAIYSIIRLAVVISGLAVFIKLDLSRANLLGILIVLLVSSFAFIGLGLMAAVLPVFSPERGAEATNIFQGCLLLVSGVYYPVEILPGWLQPFAKLSPATYSLSACRKLMGLGSGQGQLVGAPISEVAPALLMLTLMGVVMVPAGLWVFGHVERWAKKTGKLKRTG